MSSVVDIVPGQVTDTAVLTRISCTEKTCLEEVAAMYEISVYHVKIDTC
jgi:hypothetical protein